MKQIFTLLAALLCTSVFAQTNSGDTSLCDSTVTYRDNTPYSKIIFAYDTKGNNTSKTSYDWQNGQWTETSKEEYTFDSNGNMTSEASYFKIGEQWMGSYKTGYVFDGNGNQTSSIIYSYQGDKWVEYSKDEYTYDEKNRKTSKTPYRWSGFQWYEYERGMKQEYAYYNDGKPECEIYYNNINGTWVKNSKNEFIYDDKGNLTGSKNYSWQGSWVAIPSDTEYKYYYDDKGNRTSEVTLKLRNGVWENTKKIDYAYDSNNNVICKSFYNWEEGDWAITDKYEYTFDSNNKQTSLTSSKRNNGELNFVNKYEYSFDNKGNQIGTNYYLWKDNQWTLSYSLINLYYYNGTPTGISTKTIAPASRATRKIMQNGRIQIVTGNRVYGIGGEQIR